MKQLQALLDEKKAYPKAPTKPSLPTKHTSSQVEQYAKEMKQYEELHEQWREERNTIDDFNKKIDDRVYVFMIEESGADKFTPKQQAILYTKAWQDGHSYGYSEVLLYLQELVDLVDQFNEAK